MVGFNPLASFRSVGLPNAQDAQKTCKTGLLTRKLPTGLSGAENNFKNPLTFSEIPSKIKKDKRRTVEAKTRLLKKVENNASQKQKIIVR